MQLSYLSPKSHFAQDPASTDSLSWNLWRISFAKKTPVSNGVEGFSDVRLNVAFFWEHRWSSNACWPNHIEWLIYNNTHHQKDHHHFTWRQKTFEIFTASWKTIPNHHQLSFTKIIVIILPTSYICTYWQLHVWNGDLESQRLLEGAWPRLALTARLVAVTDRGQRR